jgi:peptidyl-prolyl cis-trans isomerase C
MPVAIEIARQTRIDPTGRSNGHLRRPRLTVNQARLIAPAIAFVLLLFFTGCGASPDNDVSEQTGSNSDAISALHYGQDAQIDDREIVARVADSVITLSAVRQEAARREDVVDADALLPGDPIFEDTLDALIDQRLLALEALRRGVDDNPVARSRLAVAEERILGNVLVEETVAATVTDDAIERLYREQLRLLPNIEEIRARHILVDTRDEADEVVRLLGEGTDFAQLASRVSQDPATRFNGGDLGYFTSDSIISAFAQIAFATPEGTLSEPFETEYGWHVLEVLDRRPRPRPGLEEMRGQMVRFLTLQGMDSLLNEIRGEFQVERVTDGQSQDDEVSDESDPSMVEGGASEALEDEDAP